MSQITNIAAYHFAPLHELETWQHTLKSACGALNLKGTILLAPEGINAFLAGENQAVDDILSVLRNIDGFADLKAKFSYSDHIPFKRLFVKIKREIITFGVDGIDPVKKPAPVLPPEVLKQWLDEKRPLVLLDTRNDYEVLYGTFENAIVPDIHQFTEFKSAVENLPSELKDQPVVTFCTGGIRCEKAAPLMQSLGFNQVYQLEGGILNYFEKCGGAHYEGGCFVFDERTSLSPDLRQAGGGSVIMGGRNMSLTDRCST